MHLKNRFCYWSILPSHVREWTQTKRTLHIMTRLYITCFAQLLTHCLHTLSFRSFLRNYFKQVYWISKIWWFPTPMFQLLKLNFNIHFFFFLGRNIISHYLQEYYKKLMGFIVEQPSSIRYIQTDPPNLMADNFSEPYFIFFT